MADSTSRSQGRFDADNWIEALRRVAQGYGLPASPQAAKLAGLWQKARDDRSRVKSLARGLGLRVQFRAAETFVPTSSRLPVIVWMRSGDVAVITAISDDGAASLMLSDEGGLENSMPLDRLQAEALLFALPRPVRSAPDARVDGYIRPYREHWLRTILLKDGRSYIHVLVSSVVMNLLGLATVLFSMQVYDRVVPAQSFPTLYILYFGVLLGFGFEFALRRLRMRITDILGKRVDMRMSDQVFGHALRVRNQNRPTSTGSFISQLRDLEPVREMLTSTTVTAVSDIPFFLLFLVIFWYIGGSLVLVPLGAVVLLVAPSLLAQRRLRALSTEATREAALRNAMLVEAVQGIEDIKSLQAEHRFQNQWNHYNAVTGEAQLRLRGLTNTLTAWAQIVQNGTYATIILFGAPQVMNGDITTGALVAASILGSRMMAPMAGLAQLLNRLQQARMGLDSLNAIMQMPVDNPEEEQRIHAPALAGKYTLRGAEFEYAEANGVVALKVASLDIRPGEKIAVLGRNGAGKSTLLQALSGLLVPTKGEVLLDDMTMAHVDPADIRRDVGLVTQNSRLFHGTIRDNLTMGAPQATDEDILRVLNMVGAADFIRRNRAGLEYVVREGGAGLSGGQVQALLLARLLLREPSVVLLDEPTAAMDEVSERHFIEQFKTWAAARTVVIATHRMRVLELADRILVVQNGRISHDADKQTALAMLQGKARQA